MIICPACKKELWLKLLPDYGSGTWCALCGQELMAQILAAKGVTAEELARIEPWSRRVRELFESGDEVSDADYAARWRELRVESIALAEELRRHLPVTVAMMGAPSIPEGTDAEILLRRRHRIDEKLYYDYGYQLGAQLRAKKKAPPATDNDVPAAPSSIPADHREAYRNGFFLGSHVGVFDAAALQRLASRVRR